MPPQVHYTYCEIVSLSTSSSRSMANCAARIKRRRLRNLTNIDTSRQPSKASRYRETWVKQVSKMIASQAEGGIEVFSRRHRNDVGEHYGNGWSFDHPTAPTSRSRPGGGSWEWRKDSLRDVLCLVAGRCFIQMGAILKCLICILFSFSWTNSRNTFCTIYGNPKEHWSVTFQTIIRWEFEIRV